MTWIRLWITSGHDMNKIGWCQGKSCTPFRSPEHVSLNTDTEASSKHMFSLSCQRPLIQLHKVILSCQKKELVTPSKCEKWRNYAGCSWGFNKPWSCWVYLRQNSCVIRDELPVQYSRPHLLIHVVYLCLCFPHLNSNVFVRSYYGYWLCLNRSVITNLSCLASVLMGCIWPQSI